MFGGIEREERGDGRRNSVMEIERDWRLLLNELMNCVVCGFFIDMCWC